MKQIIINADDFGLNSSANQAIVELFQKKAISSATLMTTLGESSAEAIILAKKYKIPVGLHFNLTFQNTFYANRQAFESAYIHGQLNKIYVQAELIKQYETLVDAGIRPTHIDSHQHIHNLPGVFRIIAKFAKSKNIPVRLVLEWPIGNIKLKKLIYLIFGLINLIQAKIIGVKTNSALTSFFAIQPKPAEYTQEVLSSLLAALPNRGELMCHPATSTAKMNGYTSIGDISEQEYRLMTNEKFLAMISSLDIQLINYKDL